MSSLVYLILHDVLSKSMGQILRISASLHILFHLDKETRPENIDVIISEDAITAATHFVEVCGQHVAFIAGRGEIDKEIKLLELGAHTPVHVFACISFLHHRMHVSEVDRCNAFVMH